MSEDVDSVLAKRWARLVFEEDDHELVPDQLTDPMDHERCFAEIRYLKIFAVEFYASGEPLNDFEPLRGPSVPERQRALGRFREIVRSSPDGPTLESELDRRLPYYWEAARAAEGDEHRDVVPRVGEAFARLLPRTSAPEQFVRFVGLVLFNEFTKLVS